MTDLGTDFRWGNDLSARERAERMDPDQLTRNARHHVPNPVLERAVTLWATDRDAFDRLPRPTKAQFADYQDFRACYLTAVDRGLVDPDGKTPRN